MKRCFALAVLLLGFYCVSFGQAMRTVTGRVVDKDGNPVLGALLTVKSCQDQFKSSPDGNFTFQVPYSCREVKAAKQGYTPAVAEIDGSFLILRLVFDLEGFKREAEARELAIKDSLRLAAEAAKAEADAKSKAAHEWIVAAEKARKEAEAQAKADAAAAAKAERDSLAALEKARREAEARAKAEASAKAKAERKAKAAELDAKYDERFKNRGLAHSIDAGYAYELVNTHYIIYKYSGERAYDNLHPLQFTYTLSWKFNRWVSLGVGSGALFNAKSISITNDEFAYAPEFKEYRADIPVFVNARMNFCRTVVRPYISITGGFYCLSKQVMAEGGIGCEFRFARVGSMHLQASANIVPWPLLMYSGYAAYDILLAPGVKLGFDF